MVSGPSGSYHHGNLKEALVDAAEGLLAERGIDRLSLRAAARRSGVSQAAPYAHFAGRQALLAAVATRGFNRLGAYLHEAERNNVDAVGRMGRLARAYVAFALDYPMLFRLMFGTELCEMDDAALSVAGQASYAYIRAAVSDRAAAEAAAWSVDDASLAAWSLVHGLAMLIVDGRQPWPQHAVTRDALVDRVVSVYTLNAR